MAEPAELDFAWNVGFVRARKAEKKLAKNGLCVGAILKQSYLISQGSGRE